MGARRFVSLALAAAVAAPLGSALAAEQAAKPNVVFILADDLGYGDLGCYGATRVATPNLDRLAAGGLRFTNAHAPSATCTPTRYSILTGEYAWRRKGTGVLPGDAALIIEPGRPTLASILKEAGYAIGCVGKWHLGLGAGAIDWNGEIRPGPLDLGFDYAFIIPATGDRVPCVYVEDRRVVGLDPEDPIRVSYKGPVGDEPTGRARPDLLKVKPSHGHDQTIVGGVSRIGHMAGGRAARWVDEDMADVITRKAVAFIERNRDRPFFLYFATHDIHVPRLPHARFAGKSGSGVRGDVIEELDWCAGEVMAALDRLGLARSTLVIFSSDNGPVLDDGYADGAVGDSKGHAPAGPLRGGKYSLYEGGTRVPFIARWPGRVKTGVSGALVSQIDLMASLAALAGQKLPPEAGPDSLNVLTALLGESKTGREHLVEHAGGLAIRKGPWKLIPREPRAKKAKAKQSEPEVTELFNLDDDPGETKNIAGRHPEVVKELAELLQKIRDREK